MFRKIQESQKALEISGNIATAMKLLWGLWLWGRMKQYFGRVFPKKIRIDISLNTQKASCFLRANGHLNAFRDVFIEEEYKLELHKDPEVIVDLGSNIGLSVIYFKLRYPQAKVHAFEPHPALFKQLEKNTDQLNDVYLHQKIVSNKQGETEFYINDDKPLSSSIHNERQSSRRVKIQSITLDDILGIIGEEKIDILKFDIEGAERDVFASFSQWNILKTLIGELHYELVSVPEEELNALFTHNTEASIQKINAKRSIIYAQSKKGGY